MLTLCLIAQISGTMILRDCTATSHVYAFKRGTEIHELNWREVAIAYNIRPSQKPIGTIQFLNYTMPAPHEDLNQ